jgi:signal transduction histidine kinase
MKGSSKYITLLLLFIVNLSFGQDREYAEGMIKISDSDPNTSKAEGLSDTLIINDKRLEKELNQGWRVIFQDDSTYKSTDFNDKSWNKTGIDTEYQKLTAVKSDTIAWFRKTIYVDSATVGVPLLFFIRAAGAWEFYVDGELQGTFGKIEKEQRETLINLKNERLPYLFKEAGTHQLAFRFLFDITGKLNKGADLEPIRLIVGRSDHDSFKKDTFDIKEAIGIVIGLFLLAAIIHWFFYYQFKTSKRDSFNLYASISMLLFALYGYFSSPSLRTFSVDWWMTRELIEAFLFVTGHCMLLIAVHKYLSQKSKTLLWTTVAVVFLLGFVSNLTLNTPYNNYSDSAAVLILLGAYTYLLIKAKRQKIKSSKTLLNALLYFLIAIALTIALLVVISIVSFVSYNQSDLQSNIFSVMSLFLIVVLAGPQLAVSFAISSDLAKEFVLTNKMLSKKVVEIEHLSQEKEEILTKQNEKLEGLVTKRTSELNQSVIDLKSTQAQLVQSEKLASLGELTAGIAHEIQNPLNFVNNFSEVSEELVEEVLEERVKEKDQRDEELEEELLTDLKENLKKINHHGNRASSIVRSMLEHSRMSTGEKAQVNINALADEYLRLAYHGLRAKDRSLFNAKIETHFDEDLPA